MTIEIVLRQHAEEAGFNWYLRTAAVHGGSYSVTDLSKLDSKIRASLAGLRVAKNYDWNTHFRVLGQIDQGDTFSFGVVAIEKISADLLRLADACNGAQEKESELISALGWVENQFAESAVDIFLRQQSEFWQRIAFSGLAVRRQLDAETVEKALSNSDVQLIMRALRSAGEMSDRRLLTCVRDHLRSEDEACRFWAAWSCVLLGDKSAAETLKSFVEFQTEFASRAMQLAPRVLDSADCQQWLRGLAQIEAARRLALVGCGVIGDPVYIPTLIGQMSVPEHARVAGEAFSMITGVDLAYEDLDMDQPEDFEAGPNDDPEDDNVDLDPDQDLPWPNPELIQKWWDDHGREYRPGVRYLCGQSISDENCRRVLREGYQRQRIAAAYELALMNPDEPLFEWRAPGWRQQEWLGLRKPRVNRPASD